MTFILLRHLCEAWLAIDYFACNASVWNLMMIAIDRYQGATKPLSHLVNRTSKKERENKFMCTQNKYPFLGNDNDWHCMGHFIPHLGHSNRHLEIHF